MKNRAKKTNYKRRRRDRSNEIGIVVITLVVAFLAIVVGNRISTANDKVDTLNNKISELEEQYEEQKTRAIELEERKVYVQTKAYVEEVAKKLGLVYPNEIIYKPSK